MCEFTSRILELEKAMSGRFVNDLFPMHVSNRYPYQVVQEGQCLECSRTLWDKDRRPSGRATRSLCDWCYTNLIANTINHNCFICGQLLPDFKVRDQKINRREISHHIDDGYCLDYFTLVHCKVVGGVNMTFLGNEQPEQRIFQNEHYQVAPHTDINERSAQVSRQVENLKKMIHQDLVRQQILSDRKILDVPNRYLLDAPGQKNALEFRSNDIEIDHDSVSVIRLPKKV